jgi:hypothetical protein
MIGAMQIEHLKRRIWPELGRGTFVTELELTHDADYPSARALGSDNRLCGEDRQQEE